MHGFDKKVFQLKHEENNEITFKIEVDFVGDGKWSKYSEIKVPASGYEHHVFPEGFSAHWVRLTSNSNGKVTAYFLYQKLNVFIYKKLQIIMTRSCFHFDKDLRI